MSTSKEIILDLFETTYNSPGWNPTISDVIEGLALEQAIWKPRDHLHNIWDLLNHLIYWNDRWLRRFNGAVPPETQYDDNTATFSQADFERTEENWVKTIERVHEVCKSWIKAITYTNDEKLVSPVSEQLEGKWWNFLTNLNLHNSYHVGQIITLRKEQGKWVDTY